MLRSLGFWFDLSAATALVDLTAASALAVLMIAAAGEASGGPIFRDDFDVDGRPNPDAWVVNHPECDWPDCTMWSQGRTHFPEPDNWVDDGTYPIVRDGSLYIEHHLYNPYDEYNDPNIWFLGGEVHTVMQFEPNKSYRFEARVKLNPGDSPYAPYPNGLVTSFFLYGYDGSNSDEIDYEFLSNLMNDDSTYPLGDPVLTNTWNESFQKPLVVTPEGLNLTEWNTFRIYWDPGERVEWTWLHPVDGEVSLRTETDVFYIPDEAMALYFNFWAPCYEPVEGRPSQPWTCDQGWWEEAADLNLQPVNDPSEIYSYEIDYVEVVPEPSTILLIAFGLAGLALGHKRRSS